MTPFSHMTVSRLTIATRAPELEPIDEATRQAAIAEALVAGSIERMIFAMLARCYPTPPATVYRLRGEPPGIARSDCA